MTCRILFLGENWFGSCARACAYALRRAGCDVVDLDAQTFIPQWARKSNRAALRLMHRRIIREYNDRLLQVAENLRPDFVLAFKGQMVETASLGKLRASGVALYNYFPDTIPADHGELLANSISGYDCIFYTKKFWDTRPPREVEGPALVFLPHGYDSELHRPLPLEARDIAQYGHDVTVIASQTPYKEKLLTDLVRLVPGLDLQIYGDRWNNLPSDSALRRHVRGFPLFGDPYVKALRAAKINVALVSWTGRIEIDETTTRTFEIPACGGFMLHERTPELLELYEEGVEVAAFGSADELAQKIEYYLAHPEEREAIARAGHERCVPAYSYDERMKEILRYFTLQRAAQEMGCGSIRS